MVILLRWLAAGLGQGIGNVVDSVNPVDDFAGNLQSIIIAVVCVVAGVVVIIIIVVVICFIANKKEITRFSGKVVEKYVPGCKYR
jgi:thiosulfate reductase cytochrome b subunit